MSLPDLTTVDAERICLIKPSALGDVVQTLPLLPALRQRFPRAGISWVVNRSLAELLEGQPELDEIIPFDRRGRWSDWLNFGRQLRARRFDLVLDLQGLFRTALMTFATRAPLRVGLQTAREAAHLACHHTLPDTGPQVPAHLRYWRVAEAFGVGDLSRTTPIAVDADARRWVRDQLQRFGGKAGKRDLLLAVHPGARWATKRWPVEKFAAVAAKAARSYGFQTLILGAPGEEPLATQLEQLLRRFVPTAGILNLTGKTNLQQLAALLGEADVVLTNDSGPMHLAAATGTSVVGVFTCTSPLRSGPPGDHHALVSTELPCAGSYKKRCPYRGRRHQACFDELVVDRVWTAFVRLMERRQAEKRAA